MRPDIGAVFLGYAFLIGLWYGSIHWLAARIYRNPAGDPRTAYQLRRLRRRGYLTGSIAIVLLGSLFNIRSLIGRVLFWAGFGTPTSPVLTAITMVGLLAGPGLLLVLVVRLATLPYRQQARELDLYYREISQWVLTRGLSGIALLFAIISLVWLVPPGWSRILTVVALGLGSAVLMPYFLIYTTRARAITPHEQRIVAPAISGTNISVRVVDDRTRFGVAFAAGIVPGTRFVFITESLFEMLSPDEVSAVVAHEVGHHQHHHVLYRLCVLGSGIVAWLAAVELKIPYGFVVGGVLFIPFLLGAYYLIRRTEYDADAYATNRLGNTALGGALLHLSELHLNLSQTGVLGTVVSVHPTIADRVARMQKISSALTIADDTQEALTPNQRDFDCTWGK